MAGGRIYTDIVQVGDVSIYNVTSNPNGVLSANQGDLAIQTTPGQPGTWKNVDGGTSWSQIDETETRKVLGVTASLTAVNSLAPSASNVAFDLTIPEDCTIKQVGFTVVSGDEGPVDVSHVITINQIQTFGGGGPDDSKGGLYQGNIPASLFSTLNDYPSPDLNLRCVSGDTLRFRLTNLSGTIVVFRLSVTYTPGYDMNQLPNQIQSNAGIILFARGSEATGSITVVSAPLTAGDTIDMQKPGDGLSTLTGVAGARTPGADDFDASIGTVTGLRDEILAALSDSSNSFAEGWTFAASGVDSIDITASQPGAFRNADTLSVTTASPGALTVSGANLTGGTKVAGAGFISSPPHGDVLVHSMFIQGVVGEGLDFTAFFDVTELEIDGSPVPNISGENAGSFFGCFYNKPVPIDVLAPDGSAIRVDLVSSGIETGGAVVALFCRPVN
jgi:hypothetical protein